MYIMKRCTEVNENGTKYENYLQGMPCLCVSICECHSVKL